MRLAPTLTSALVLAGVVGPWPGAAPGPRRAAADEVTTGANARLARAVPQRYTRVYTVYQIDGLGASILVFGGGARVGDAFDLVDRLGYVGRLLVDRVEQKGCGGARYEDVRARFAGKPPGRPIVEAVLALAPARRPPTRARVLAGGEVRSAPGGQDGLQAIDLDGDGVPELLHYQLRTCGRRAVSDDTAACFETWERVGTAWRRLERAEFPVCDRS